MTGTLDIELSVPAFARAQRTVGGGFHRMLNTGARPIVNKYHEGTMKRTLKRKLKVFEFAEWKAD